MKGNLFTAIRPPTVEEGKSRLRISLTVDHEEKDIDYLINILDMISKILYNKIMSDKKIILGITGGIAV